MPVTITCCQPHCDRTIDQSLIPDTELGPLWYCDYHKSPEQRECDFSGCNRLGIYSDPKITGEYCLHHRRVMMEIKKDTDHNSETEKLKEALDRATYAFEFIIAQGCTCPAKSSTDKTVEHYSMCKVLAAQNGLDNIKAALGES